jgi:hypothetical protein
MFSGVFIYDFANCSGCFRLEPLPGGNYTHWKAPPFWAIVDCRQLTANKKMPQVNMTATASAIRQNMSLRFIFQP